MNQVNSNIPNVTAVIVAYNDYQSLNKCVESIISQTSQVDKIIIIDNSMSTEFQELLRIMKGTICDKLVIYRPGVNTGSAGGFSIGMDMAYEQGADWVWLHDEDDYPETDCLEKLLASNNYFIRTPVIKDPPTGNTLYYFKKKKYFGGYFYNSNPKDSEVGVTGTAGMLIHRSVIEKTGVYNPDYFTGYEDYDYCIRAARCGFKIAVIKNAILWHPDKQSTMIKENQKLENFLRFFPAFFGAIKKTSKRDYYTVRNFICLSRKYNYWAVFLMQILISFPLLLLYSFFNKNIDLKKSLKTYSSSI
jgi:rhamnopyranosyl-N-acetylglucosaminyl-diphospho-decaprenol beta-1,3/1,4-galactofuranosyltransferase